MSDENEQGEEKPKDDLAGSDEFEFYFSFTKPLVLDLPSSEDRAIAAAWVQKLEAEPESEEEKQLRLNYLKLLLFVLQRGRLSGIFKKQPPAGPLQPFPQGFSIIDMGNWMLDQDDGQPCGGGDARSVPYNIEISNDLREFVASQEVPNFGIQMYYAWSSEEPIHKWASFDEEKFPQFILDKIKQLKEIKSDERSTIGKNGCMTKKKGCELSLPDKYSKKKVKSPQEIERAQGRSFHTYMGLVGRMGNFNDKCDDDPEKFQRQEQRKAKCAPPRRSPQKRCPTGGEADDMMAEDDYDNLVSGLGGLSTQGRTCHCPPPCQHENCPDHHPKGGPQAFEPSPGRNGYGTRGDVEVMNCPPGASKSPPRRVMEDPCAELQMPQMPSPQRNGGRSRSGSPNRPPECPPEDEAGGFPKHTGACICSKPPCTCPCPRGSSPTAASNANPGGRASPEPNRCPPPEMNRCPPPEMNRCPPPEMNRCPPPEMNRCPPPEMNRCPPPEMNRCPPPETNRCSPPKPAKQDMCGPEGYGNRSAPSYNVSPKSPDNCPPMGSPNVSGSTRSGGASMRTGQAEVIHCYDSRNPDPALYDKIDKGWMDLARERGNKRLDADFQNFMAREQPSPAQSIPNSRRGLFNPLAQSTPIVQEPCGVPSDIPRHAGRFCPPAGPASSPPMQQNQCDYSGQDDSNGNYSMMPANYSNQQNFMECDDGGPFSPIRSPQGYGQTQKSDPCRKSPPQNMSKNKSFGGAQVCNDNGRMANMASVLQGMKQKTEAHREKCDPAATRRSPPNDAAKYNAQAAPQSSRANCDSGKQRSQMALDSAMPQGNSCPPRNARSGQQVQYSPQAKSAQQCAPYQEKGYVNLPNAPQAKQQQPSPQRQMRSPAAAPVSPECYPNNQQQGFQECEYEEDSCDADSGEYDDPCQPPQNMQQAPMPCPPSSMPQGMMPQNMMQQSMMPPNCIPPNTMQQGANAPMQEMPQTSMAQMLACDPDPQKQNIQWMSMNSMGPDSSKCLPPSPYQSEMPDADGRCVRPQKCPPQSSSPQRSSPPARASPPRSGSPRSSPPRGSPPRSSPGRGSASQRDCTISTGTEYSSRSIWSTNTPQASGNRNQEWMTPPCRPMEFTKAQAPENRNREWMTPPSRPVEFAKAQAPENRNQEWMTPPSRPMEFTKAQAPECREWMTPPSRPMDFPKAQAPENRNREWMTPPSRPMDPRCDVQPPPSSMPCPPPSNPCPPPNNACPPANMPCQPQQRSPANYSNYPPQAMNAELQYQDDECDDDMGDDTGMDMNDMEGCDTQAYIPEDETCEDDTAEADFNACSQEDYQNCDSLNIMAISSLDGADECYDDYQDMNDCDPMPPPPNMAMNRSGGVQRNGGGQRNCNPPPPTNNRNANCPDPFSGGILRR